MRERAARDADAAAQVHATLSDNLRKLEAVTEFLARPSLITRLVVRRARREEQLEALRGRRTEIEEDLAQLEERWPQLK